jgi:hypothetical protein
MVRGLGAFLLVLFVAPGWSALDGELPKGPPLPRGTQRCLTECQSRKTDCIDACDGETVCEKECQKQAEVCTDYCIKREAGQPAPGQPAPGQPAPGQPAPGQPAPGQPAPGQPAPGQPAPGRPAPPVRPT